MRSKMVVTCFTDIKGSTALTEKLGHHGIKPIRDDHLRAGKIFVGLNNGRYIKNVGDAHVATFDYVEDAINFVTQLQEYHKPCYCLSRENISIRIGLFLGLVEPTSDDVFGSGVNQAARVEAKTEAEMISVNEDLYKAIITAWGKEKADKFFEDAGEHELKGISQKQRLFTFNWNLYAAVNHDFCLAKIVYDCLEKSGIDLLNLDYNDLNTPGYIIWPVVPRNHNTAIHRGQIEIIKLIAFLGWKIHLLIADCGSNPTSKAVSTEFIAKVEKHALFRGICNIEISKLSDYFDASNPASGHVLDMFRKITTDMTVDGLFTINKKRYSEHDKEMIQAKPTIDFLRPVLTGATVLHLIDKYNADTNTKSIVIAGVDEHQQWRDFLKLLSNNIGAAFNPEFQIIANETSEAHTALQKANWPLWFSKKELEDDTKKTNVVYWVYKLFAQLPSFPSSTVTINGIDIHSCTKDEDILADVTVSNLIEKVWPILNFK